MNVEALLVARKALSEATEAAKFQWRAKCEWLRGTHSRSTVEGFFGLGEEQMHKSKFTFDADHPEVFASEDHAATPVEILAKLVAGEVKPHLVPIPPGLHAREVALRLEDAGITEGARFVALAFDLEFTHELGVRAASLEGYLLPESYRFRRDTPADEVLRTMVEHFHAAWNDDDHARLAEFRFSLHELVTLASIVEKETGVAEERARIAAVFDNRLQRRLRLQSDPTVIYGIIHETGEFDGNIRRRDLETDTPYNTYTRGGFPPGPIANPSMEAIRAVLEPEDSPYLYFVAKNDGTPFFSSRLKDHNNAVNRYQRRRSPANGN